MFTGDNRNQPHPTSIILLVASFALSACGRVVSAQETTQPIAPATHVQSILPSPAAFTFTPPPTGINPQAWITSTPTPTQVPTVPASTPTRLPPEAWKSLPVIPTSVSQTARDIYTRGLAMGNNPHAFSKIGDCQSISTFFLTYFDMPQYYDLGPFQELQETIDWYAGSFSRESLAVKGGFNAAAILSPLRADPHMCYSNENPVMCELRLNHPSVVIISLEEWWAGHPENYEKYMRQIIEYVISKGVVPILGTKADNLEGNYLIDQTIADLAVEYDVPLWNFWASVQELPNHGLVQYDPWGQIDLFHLTHSESYYHYNDPNVEPSGWSMRNLTALQALDAVRRGLAEQP
jgi:hypothetical protein